MGPTFSSGAASTVDLAGEGFPAQPKLMKTRKPDRSEIRIGTEAEVVMKALDCMDA
jgi:hypothetical protein